MAISLKRLPFVGTQLLFHWTLGEPTPKSMWRCQENYEQWQMFRTHIKMIRTKASAFIWCYPAYQHSHTHSTHHTIRMLMLCFCHAHELWFVINFVTFCCYMYKRFRRAVSNAVCRFDTKGLVSWTFKLNLRTTQQRYCDNTNLPIRQAYYPQTFVQKCETTKIAIHLEVWDETDGCLMRLYWDFTIKFKPICFVRTSLWAS